ncbi:ABC transporter permease (plasmid) [Streptomyces sp. BI20]|uniref:ABC transporter permease n=1 Tax=Streptomyces sp. BI20 TaxID=3403460 RepID=UPI003C74C3AF
MLSLANLRERPLAFLGAFLTVLVGTALVTTTLVLHDSTRPTVQPRYAGATALVLPARAHDTDGSPEDRIPWSPAEAEALRLALAAVPGVTAAVLDRSFYAQALRGDTPVTDPGALETGRPWSTAALDPRLRLTGRAPTADHEVVVDRALGAGPGDTVTLNLTQGRRPFTVTGTVDGTGTGTGPALFFADAFAARQHPGVDAIALTTAPDTTPASAASVVVAARAHLTGGATLVTGTGRAAIQPAHLEHQRFLGVQLLGAMAVLALFTTVFVVASLLALATGTRRREIGLLRTLGATPAQIRRMVLGEAAATGLLGSLAGIPTGIAAAPLLRDLLAGLDVTPADLPITVSAWPPLTAGAIGVGVSVLAAWAAGRKAARVAPVEALLDGRAADAAPGRARLLTGLGVLAAGLLLATAGAGAAADDRVNAAILSGAALIVAAALLAPVLVGPAGRLLTAPFRRAGRRRVGAGPLLIHAELVAHPRRAGALVAPVIAAVGFAVLLSGIVETMRVAYPAGQARQVAGQSVITPDGIPGNTDETVAANPVGKAALPTRAFVPTPGRGEAGAEAGLTVLDVLGSRDPRWNRPGEAVLGERTARELGLAAGGRVPVRFADGATVTLTVAAVLPEDPARGAFVVPRDLVRAHDPGALTDDLFVPAGAPASDAVPGTARHDAAAYALADYETDARLTESLARMLIVIAVGYSVIAVANGTAMAAHARRRDLAVLRSAGGTSGALLRIVAGETALLVLVGAGLGVLVTLPPLAGMASGLSQATSADVGTHLAAGTLALAVLGTLAVAVGVVLTVTRRGLARARA